MSEKATPSEQFLKDIIEADATVARALEFLEQDVAKKTGLHLSGRQIFYLLMVPKDGCTTTELQRLTARYSSNISYSTQALLNHGLLTARIVREDRRLRRFALTEKGRNIRAVFEEVLNKRSPLKAA